MEGTNIPSKIVVNSRAGDKAQRALPLDMRPVTDASGRVVGSRDAISEGHGTNSNPGSTGPRDHLVIAAPVATARMYLLGGEALGRVVHSIALPFMPCIIHFLSYFS